ncbi:sirohydrochlorin chelatase [Streptomyces sp. NPDC050504]|uniref:sirohydrochlorin chelatase n=1 Tax=Streptomyces sp. NPDC050504 TaxID=3365618 RepID=UPI00378FA34A
MSTAALVPDAPPLVLVAHGTRDAEGVAATLALADRVRALRPGLRVELGWLDLVEPGLDAVLARLRGAAVLVPLLLGNGFHVRGDIPDALSRAPHLRARTARALGPDPLLADALAELLGPVPAGSPVVLAAAGSTDPAANAETARMAGLLAERTGARVSASYLCAAAPTPRDAVAALRAGGHARVLLARYLLAPGHFARRAALAGAHRVSAPLIGHPAVAALVLARYEEAAARPPHPVRGNSSSGRSHSTAGGAARTVPTRSAPTLR